MPALLLLLLLPVLLLPLLPLLPLLLPHKLPTPPPRPLLLLLLLVALQVLTLLGSSPISQALVSWLIRSSPYSTCEGSTPP